MADSRFPEHPENDLHGGAGGLDDANRRPPEPRTLEDLANAPDPMLQYERNRASTRQAVQWTVGAVLFSAAVSLVLAIAFRTAGGPICEAGRATWLCSRTAEIWWAIGSSVTPVAAVIGCALIMLRKLRAYVRWGPWMGAFWFLVPHGLAWLITTLPMGALGHAP